MEEIRVKMEEEEGAKDLPRKQRRKRKPPRDLSPMTPKNSDNEEEEDVVVEEKKKKRGRKKKKKEPVIDDESKNFNKVFKVVEQLMLAAGSDAFMDRPDDSNYGMSDYYEVITKPMWLREVERKHKLNEYSSVTEMAADVRLMLENCYHYWGPCDTLSKRALKLEQTFETKLAALPQELQKLCSIEATHGDIIKEEPDDSSAKKTRKNTYQSKLLNWVLNGRGRNDGDLEKPASSQETFNKGKKAGQEVAEKQLLAWETDQLLNPTIIEQIASMWEFPVIGQFLHLVYEVLQIEPISHVELERMLLMPQASNTLATLFTSMLLPPLFRAKLDAGPAMPYNIWTRRLSTKVASWYRAYHSKGDSTVEVSHDLLAPFPAHKVFDSLGIEPQFWLVLGEENPLEDYVFHELTFLQRVWLLKGLCDFLLHNHKTIQECINNLDMKELREQKLGRDKDGYSYHYFPMFTEVRIYKMAKVSDAKWKDYEGGVEEAITMCAEEEDDDDQSHEQSLIGFSRRPLHRPPRSMRPSHSEFRLVCQSLDDVRQLVDKMCDDDPVLLQGQGVNAPLVAKLQLIISQLESREAKMELAVFKVRSRMREEWIQFNQRASDFVDPGSIYWERKEKEEKRAQASEEKSASVQVDLAVPGTSSDTHDQEKRERRTRRESTFKMMSENGMVEDESAEESPLDFGDDSEDEWFASKKDKENKKKKRHISVRKNKKLAEIDRMNQLNPSKDKDMDKIKLNSAGNKVQGSLTIKTTEAVNESIKIKQEPTEFNNVKILPEMNNKTANGPSIPQPINISKEASRTITQVKQEVVDDIPSTNITSAPTSVIQSLVRPVNATNVKMEQASRQISLPDLSKVKRSKSPEDVICISDSEETSDVKPNPTLLNKQLSSNRVETISYSMSVPQQPPVREFLMQNTVPNQPQFLPVNVAPGDQVFNPQSQVFNVPQQPTQPLAYQAVVQQPIIRPTIATNPTMVRLHAPQRSIAPNLQPNQKFLVIKNNTANSNQPNQLINKSPRSQVPTSPTMQSVNWLGSQSSPRQSMMVGRGLSPRGRGSPRTALTPTRGASPRFATRTPPNNVRTPTQIGARSPSPMRGRGIPTPIKPGTGPVRSLNFNRSPVKPVNKVDDIPVNDSPDIEGTLVVSMTDSGGFGYVVMLADGGKISLTQDQLAKIRSDNGGTLPKTCKVPLNMQTEGFRID